MSKTLLFFLIAALGLSLNAQHQDCLTFSEIATLETQVEDDDTLYYYEFNPTKGYNTFLNEFRFELAYVLLNYSSAVEI